MPSMKTRLMPGDSGPLEVPPAIFQFSPVMGTGNPISEAGIPPFPEEHMPAEITQEQHDQLLQQINAYRPQEFIVLSHQSEYYLAEVFGHFKGIMSALAQSKDMPADHSFQPHIKISVGLHLTKMVCFARLLAERGNKDAWQMVQHFCTVHNLPLQSAIQAALVYTQLPEIHPGTGQYNNLTDTDKKGIIAPFFGCIYDSINKAWYWRTFETTSQLEPMRTRREYFPLDTTTKESTGEIVQLPDFLSNDTSTDVFAQLEQLAAGAQPPVTDDTIKTRAVKPPQ